MPSSHAPDMTPDTPKSITIHIQGVGHVPSFKNGKMLSRGRLITSPIKQKWMQETASGIESQLRSLYQTTETGTETEQSLQSWILTSLPLDDSLKWIGLPCGGWQRVKKGSEGAIVVIEKL